MERNRYLILSKILLAFCLLLLLSGLSKADNLSGRVDDKIRKLSPAPETLKIPPKLLTLAKVQVPNLHCKSYTEATRILKQKKLKIIKKGYVLSKACQHKSDRVISQTPRVGTKLKSGSGISVTLTSLPLTLSISSTVPYNIIKGRSLTFQAKVNYRASKFKWKLNNKLVNQRGARLKVNTSKLSTGINTVTLEVYLKHLGLGSQRKVVNKAFLVVAKPPIILKDSRQTPITKPPLVLQPKKPVIISSPVPPVSSTAQAQAERARIKALLEAMARAEEATKGSNVDNHISGTVSPAPIVVLDSPSTGHSGETSTIIPSEATPPPAPPTSTIDTGENTASDTREKHYGEILYNPPARMILKKSERIEVRIGHDPINTEGLIGTGEVHIEKIPVSTLMTVELKGSSFKIDSLNTSSKQIIDLKGYTQWAFDVTPIKSGQHNLNLSASSHYTYLNGEQITKDIPVITRVISIKVDAVVEIKSWFINNWKWVGGFIIIPILLGYLIYHLNRRKKRRRLASKEIIIFISYRRDDSSGYSLALYDRINPVFGDENVFMDLDDIPHGSDFVEHIEMVLSKAHVVLVMIGEHWIDASNDKGRRLDNPNDFVRLEVATALRRDIRVIPVLLKNAQMPNAEELPDNLKKLSRRNAIKIHDDQFEESIEKLIETILNSSKK